MLRLATVVVYGGLWWSGAILANLNLNCTQGGYPQAGEVDQLHWKVPTFLIQVMGPFKGCLYDRTLDPTSRVYH